MRGGDRGDSEQWHIFNNAADAGQPITSRPQGHSLQQQVLPLSAPIPQYHVTTCLFSTSPYTQYE